MPGERRRGRSDRRRLPNDPLAAPRSRRRRSGSPPFGQVGPKGRDPEDSPSVHLSGGTPGWPCRPTDHVRPDPSTRRRTQPRPTERRRSHPMNQPNPSSAADDDRSGVGRSGLPPCAGVELPTHSAGIGRHEPRIATDSPRVHPPDGHTWHPPPDGRDRRPPAPTDRPGSGPRADDQNGTPARPTVQGRTAARPTTESLTTPRSIGQSPITARPADQRPITDRPWDQSGIAARPLAPGQPALDPPDPSHLALPPTRSDRPPVRAADPDQLSAQPAGRDQSRVRSPRVAAPSPSSTPSPSPIPSPGPLPALRRSAELPSTHNAMICVSLPGLAISTEQGQMTGQGLEGFYRAGRRLLSRCQVRVAGREPLAVQARMTAADRARFVGTLRASPHSGPDPDVVVERLRHADGTERITLHSAALRPLRVPVEVALGTDLAELGAIASGAAQPELPASVHDSGLRWSCPTGNSSVTADPPPRGRAGLRGPPALGARAAARRQQKRRAAGAAGRSGVRAGRGPRGNEPSRRRRGVQ